MKEWVFREYDVPVATDGVKDAPMAPQQEAPVLEATGLTYAYAEGLPNVLKDIRFEFYRGSRILVVGANGACKSTVMSILGGKRMIRRGFAKVLGYDCFNDPAAARQVIYCGDWWRTNFFMNIKLWEVIGEEVVKTPRCRHLADVLQVNFDWKINNLSDGQRRRCQLLEILAVPRPIYLMDEITSDLDIFAREGILNFLKLECELRGCTIFYCTHIFDHLEGWHTHMLHLSKGKVVHQSEISELKEYSKLCSEGDSTPLYTLVRGWVYKEYEDAAGAKPWRALNSSSDGRIPN